MLPRYKAYLFERIENGDSNEYKDIYGRLDSGEYTIEYIMPQKLTSAWTSELGQDAENIHGEWLHTLANLTLTAYNSKYSNAPFNEKKTMADGYLQSGIRMTQWISSIRPILYSSSMIAKAMVQMKKSNVTRSVGNTGRVSFHHFKRQRVLS